MHQFNLVGQGVLFTEIIVNKSMFVLSECFPKFDEEPLTCPYFSIKEEVIPDRDV